MTFSEEDDEIVECDNCGASVHEGKSVIILHTISWGGLCFCPVSQSLSDCFSVSANSGKTVLGNKDTIYIDVHINRNFLFQY